MEKSNIIKYLNESITPNADILKIFLDETSDYYSRDNDVGHITASAFILSDDLKNVLLIHHAKYDMWLSPGGHGEQSESSLQAAIREAEEETGLKNLILLSSKILDIDIHRIPYSAKKEEAEHWHFDIRYVFKANKNINVNLNMDECKGYVWKPLEELLLLNNPSLKRQAEKTLSIIDSLNHKPARKFKP